jgi:hypothetical protein
MSTLVEGDPSRRQPADVIGFSNRVFYGDRLVVETDPNRFLPGPAMRWHHIRGRHASGAGGRGARNAPEAEAVVEQLGLVLDEIGGTDRAVGIVTPFRARADLLVQLAAKRDFRDVLIDVVY